MKNSYENDTCLAGAQKLALAHAELAKPTLWCSYQIVKAAGGNDWPVFIGLGSNPGNGIQWNRTAYRTAGLALGTVKRHARDNGGSAIWLILGGSTWNNATNAYDGPVSYSLFVAGEQDAKSIQASMDFHTKAFKNAQKLLNSAHEPRPI